MTKNNPKKIRVGIIGGSGIDDPGIIKNSEQINLNTPYGQTSSSIISGQISGVDVVVLARHGIGHIIPPTQVPFRANIWAFKEIGCTHILGTSACGSLREEIRPRDFVFIDQFIDFTKHRKRTFYEDFKEKIVHRPMADPFCGKLRKILIDTASELGIKHHKSGTIVTIEGSCFSTRAESRMFKGFGADVVGMTTATEAILAREAGLCYAIIGMSTDYDVWRENTEEVTWKMVVNNMVHNAKNAKKLLLKTIPKINFTRCKQCSVL